MARRRRRKKKSILGRILKSTTRSIIKASGKNTDKQRYGNKILW